jgi:hypothetical protein
MLSQHRMGILRAKRLHTLMQLIPYLTAKVHPVELLRSSQLCLRRILSGRNLCFQERLPWKARVAPSSPSLHPWLQHGQAGTIKRSGLDCPLNSMRRTHLSPETNHHPRLCTIRPPALSDRMTPQTRGRRWVSCLLLPLALCSPRLLYHP